MSKKLQQTYSMQLTMNAISLYPFRDNIIS